MLRVQQLVSRVKIPRAGILMLAAGVLVLGACTTASLEELRRTSPKGDTFQQTLSKLYLSYAESEAAQYDWFTSRRFADKGLLVTYGNEVEPEKVENWGVRAEHEAELTAARATLMEYLATRRSVEPEKAAYAQYYFDCWVEQEHDGWQEDDINACREGLASAIRLEKPESKVMDEIKEEEDYKPKYTAPKSELPDSSYLVFFRLGSAHLTPEGQRIVDDVAKELTGSDDNYMVTLNGHADRLGKDDFNMALSKKRAETAQKRLMEHGVPESRIMSFAFGETDPRVPTPDGVAEKANRRVEIVLNP